MSIFSADAVGNVLATALNGISTRQNVIADNIANIDTPHFRAMSVDFETSLRQAIADGDVRGDQPAIATAMTNTPVGVNDNNVDLRKETMAAMQSTFQYQMVTRSVGDRFNAMKIATGAF